MLLARIPLQMFQRYRSVHTQNLAQTVISSATFGAANSLLMPIAVPYVMGQPQLNPADVLRCGRGNVA
jgi:uncharacterized oligopeptide transporter (OPT) family protein